MAGTMGTHDHGPATLSIPLRIFVEEVAGRRLTVDTSTAVYRAPGVIHSDRVGAAGFDGILVEFETRQHANLEAAMGRVDEILGATGPVVARRLWAAAGPWDRTVPEFR